MDNLIEGLRLLSSYDDGLDCLQALNDLLYIYISPTEVTTDHIKELADLGFDADYDHHAFYIPLWTKRTQ